MCMTNQTKSTDLDCEERLSPHFTVGEMLRSGTAIAMGIKNVPADAPAGGETPREDEPLRTLYTRPRTAAATGREGDCHERLSLRGSEQGRTGSPPLTASEGGSGRHPCHRTGDVPQVCGRSPPHRLRPDDPRAVRLCPETVDPRELQAQGR